MDIGLNLETYLYDLCFYTGVCGKPEWEDITDESKLTVYCFLVAKIPGSLKP